MSLRDMMDERDRDPIVDALRKAMRAAGGSTLAGPASAPDVDVLLLASKLIELLGVDVDTLGPSNIMLLDLARAAWLLGARVGAGPATDDEIAAAWRAGYRSSMAAAGQEHPARLAADRAVYSLGVQHGRAEVGPTNTTEVPQ